MKFFLVTLFLLACSNPPPTPSPGEQPVNVMDIWSDYEINEERANVTWKGRWLYLRMGSIDKIDSGGKVQMNLDGFGLKTVVFDFADDSEVVPLNRLRLRGGHVHVEWASVGPMAPVQEL